MTATTIRVRSTAANTPVASSAPARIARTAKPGAHFRRAVDPDFYAKVGNVWHGAPRERKTDRLLTPRPRSIYVKDDA